MIKYPIITIKEAREILKAKKENRNEIEISIDLGMTKSRVQLKEEKGSFVLIQDEKIPLQDFEKVKENFCYVAQDNILKKIAIFSEETNLYYKLLPTKDWPTFTLSSTPMHRHTHITPRQDTRLKIKELNPVKGRALDTCCGLGYTAIMLAEYADEVHTFEWDENVVYITKINPYSQEIHTNKKITLHKESVAEGIKKFPSNYFDCVLHDPPTVKRSPELYSKQFYSELLRVMKRNARLYHYCPLINKTKQKTKGREFYKAVIKNLQRTGFKKVEYREKSCGIVAVKY